MSRIRNLLSAAEALHQSTPVLRDYAPWPGDLREQNLPPAPCPMLAKLRDFPADGIGSTDPLRNEICDAADTLHWKQTYTAEQVGAEFLANYGYVELYGPSGQFHSDELRGYIGIWGPGLTYDWHAHEAEEIYFNLAGQAVFCADGAPNVLLQPGDARAHSSNQRHLMVTLDQAIFTYVLWRGPGLAGLPKMERS